MYAYDLKLYFLIAVDTQRNVVLYVNPRSYIHEWLVQVKLKTFSKDRLPILEIQDKWIGP